MNLVWGYEYPGDVRTVDVHVQTSSGKDREQSERAEVRAYQMGRWVLLRSEFVMEHCHDKVQKIYQIL